MANHGLDSNEWRFEEQACANAFDDFEADDRGKWSSGVEVYEKAVAEGYHRGAEIDAFEIAASAVDDEAN